MRLWSLAPSYLDAKGLVAGWREALLAQKVLAGQTKGYRNHPQLERFREAADPQAAIAFFLAGLHAESVVRGYKFDASKIGAYQQVEPLPVMQGQVEYEAQFLLAKITQRAPGCEQQQQLQEALAKPGEPEIQLHPLFRVVPGGIASWEKVPD